MKEVVAYIDAKDSSGKRGRPWKTVDHKYKKFPDQSYITQFCKYIEQQGTKRHKTLNLKYKQKLLGRGVNRIV